MGVLRAVQNTAIVMPLAMQNTLVISGLLTLWTFLHLHSKPSERVIFFTVYEWHGDVKNPQEAIRLILFPSGVSGRCPFQPLLDAEVRQRGGA
jgi:hypothetical protein